MKYFVTLLIFICLTANATDKWVCPADSIAIYNYEFCEAEHKTFLADQADKKMNLVYKQLLSEPDVQAHRELWVIAQRAWLKSSAAYCEAAVSKFSSVPATRLEMKESCRENQIIRRIEELESYCDSCVDSKPASNK